MVSPSVTEGCKPPLRASWPDELSLPREEQRVRPQETAPTGKAFDAFTPPDSQQSTNTFPVYLYSVSDHVDDTGSYSQSYM